MIGLVRNQSPGIPIVVLSGLSDENAAIQTMDQGAQDYLIKGQVDARLLWRSLRYALQRQAVEERINERNRELLVLKRISETILGSLNLQVVLDRILGEAMASGGRTSPSCWIRPTIADAIGASHARPLAIRPQIAFSVEVLPAPFAPIRQTSSPSPMARSMPATARMPP